MKQLMVVGNKGYVVLGGINEKGQVWTKKLSGIYEEGNKNHTIPNVMACLARVIHNYVPVGEQARIITIGSVARKINSDILIKEAMFGYTVGKTRTKLSAQDLGMYRSLVGVLKARYGDILITDTQYISKTIKAGMFADEYNATMIYQAVKEVLDKLVPPITESPVLDAQGFDLGMNMEDDVVSSATTSSSSNDQVTETEEDFELEDCPF